MLLNFFIVSNSINFDKTYKSILQFLKDLITGDIKKKEFKKQLCNVLGFTPGELNLYRTALSHRSVREGADEKNEGVEF